MVVIKKHLAICRKSHLVHYTLDTKQYATNYSIKYA